MARSRRVMSYPDWCWDAFDQAIAAQQLKTKAGSKQEAWRWCHALHGFRSAARVWSRTHSQDVPEGLWARLERMKYDLDRVIVRAPREVDGTWIVELSHQVNTGTPKFEVVNNPHFTDPNIEAEAAASYARLQAMLGDRAA